MTEVWSVDDPAQIGLCGGRTPVRTRRQSEHVSGPKKGQRSKGETVYHVSSVPIDEGHGVEHFADAVRGQWAIESKCRARRDWAYCEDVRTRRCNENVTGAMLPARSPVFVFLAQSDMENCRAFKEELQSDRHRQENRKRGVGRTIEDAMNAPEAPTEAPRPHSVRMDGHESAPNYCSGNELL